MEVPEIHLVDSPLLLPTAGRTDKDAAPKPIPANVRLAEPVHPVFVDLVVLRVGLSNEVLLLRVPPTPLTVPTTLRLLVAPFAGMPRKDVPDTQKVLSPELLPTRNLPLTATGAKPSPYTVSVLEPVEIPLLDFVTLIVL